MRSGIRAAAIAGLVVAASLTINADVAPQSESGEIQLQLGRQFLADGRYQDALEAFQRALTAHRPGGRARHANRHRAGGAARGRIRHRAYRSAAARQGRAGRSRGGHPVRRCALGGRPLRGGGRSVSPGAESHSRPLARPPRHGAGPGGEEQAGRGHGRSADGHPPVAARSRAAPHRRRDLRAHAQVRRGGRRVHELRQPAAAERFERHSRLVARGNQVPAFLRPARAVPDGPGHGGRDSTPSISGW